MAPAPLRYHLTLTEAEYRLVRSLVEASSKLFDTASSKATCESLLNQLRAATPGNYLALLLTLTEAEQIGRHLPIKLVRMDALGPRDGKPMERARLSARSTARALVQQFKSEVRW